MPRAGRAVALGNGKTAWRAYTAAVDFFPLLRQLHHTGVSISHYCFDRALFSALARRMRQRHALQYAVGSSPLDGRGRLLELTDWVVCTGCASHDCHNALKWAISGFLGDSEAGLKDLFVVIESLRNAYDLLLGHFPAFL